MSGEKPIDDGGAAFPQSGSELDAPVNGMSLRDWFAGQAAGGMMGSGTLCRADGKKGPLEEGDIAEAAYLIADAMLAERKKAQP